MMKRAFSRLSSQLLKQSESDELQSTIRFLTRSSQPPISSLLESNKDSTIVSPDGEEDGKHVERILKVLNSTLPEVESGKVRVEAHYDVLFSQLKNIVETSIKATDQNIVKEGPVKAVDSAVPSDVLYDKLMLLQYTNQLTNAGQMARIVLSKNFTAWDKVWGKISLFQESQRRDLSLLLYFRSGNKQIRETYENEWLGHYHELHIIVQRLFWRCICREIGPTDDFASVILQNVRKIQNWQGKDVVVLYQSLFAKAHLVPETLTQGVRSAVSKNQELFIQALRELSRHDSAEKKIKKWMVRLVKMSIENKIALEKSETQSGLSIYQYRFIRSLDLTIQELHTACEGKKHLVELQRHLELILRRIHNEEQEVKSQMSLKFI